MSVDTAEIMDLLSKPIPAAPERQRTFFDIAGFPHYETVISRWYAYFLRQDENHGLNDLFLKCLLQAVQEKTGKNIGLSSYTVGTELTTDESGKRIDILITGEDDDEGKFVIIENKIYHWLHNDLDKYWDHCKAKEQDKVGILLTLTAERIPQNSVKRFVNLTHTELIGRVSSSVNNRLNNKQRLYFEEFGTALSNLTKDLAMNEQVKFYFDNREKINKAIGTKDAAFNYIVSHIQSAAEQLGYTMNPRGGSFRYIYVPSAESVYYTVMFTNLLENDPRITIIIEMTERGIKRMDIIDAQLEDRIKNSGMLHKPTEAKGKWVHYVAKEYPIDNQQLRDLSTFIAEKIKTDFEALMTVIITEIKKP